MIDLMRFTYADRDLLAKPWSRGPYSYATNGHVAVRIARRDEIDELPVAPDVQGLMDRNVLIGPLVEIDPALALPSPAGSTVEPCETCAGVGYTAKCHECRGKGEIDCPHCGQDMTCKPCSGTGEIAVKMIDGVPRIASDHGDAIHCDDCDGNGRVIQAPPTQPYELFPGVFFNVDLLRLCLTLLPGLRIEQKAFDEKPHRIVFDGGEGLLMPMRITEQKAAA